MSGDGLSLWHRIARPVGLGLGPLLLAQGRWARSNGPRLPNAPKPWSGTISGRKPLHLLGLGDSTIAGVGVDNPMNGLTAQFAKELYRYTGRGLTWDSIGQRGITAEELLEDYCQRLTRPNRQMLCWYPLARMMRRTWCRLDVPPQRLTSLWTDYTTTFPRHQSSSRHSRHFTSFEASLSRFAQSWLAMGRQSKGECGLESNSVITQ